MSTTNKQFVVAPGGLLTGRVRVPGDKSISHRAVMLGGIAEGVTEAHGFLDGDDCLATLNAFRAMGVRIDGPDQGVVTVYGRGLHGLREPDGPLNLGNSGTSMRLMAGLLSGQRFPARLEGDRSLSGRPMGRVVDPLSRMGARIDSTPEGTPPLQILPAQGLSGIAYTLPVASAQVKSSLLLAGLYAEGETCVTEPAPTRDHTELMMTGMGYVVERSGSRICLSGGGQLRGISFDVPADISSAAFFMVGASIGRKSSVFLEHVGINPTRRGIIEILRLMGADVEILNTRTVGGESVADIRVEAAPLRGVEIPEELVPLAIDEFPAVFVAAACASGRTVLRGAAELRVKESDRIQVMADGLQACGIAAEPTPDGIVIEGGALSGGRVDSHGDHRIAMAFAMAGLQAQGPIEIDNCANVNTSFPGFVDLAKEAGLRVEERWT